MTEELEDELHPDDLLTPNITEEEWEQIRNKTASHEVLLKAFEELLKC